MVISTFVYATQKHAFVYAKRHRKKKLITKKNVSLTLIHLIDNMEEKWALIHRSFDTHTQLWYMAKTLKEKMRGGDGVMWNY